MSVPDVVTIECGYLRLHLLLKREGVAVNWKKLYRTSAGASTSSGTRLTDGRPVRILCVIDDFSRECLATAVDNSISGERVAHELDIFAEYHGYARTPVRCSYITPWRQAQARSDMTKRPVGEKPNSNLDLSTP